MKIFSQFSAKNLKGGFTVLETLVAVFVLSIAIAATLAAASTGLQSSFYAKDQITAYYLAQEAIEVITNLRDRNFIDIAAPTWRQGFQDCANIECAVDSTITIPPGNVEAMLIDCFGPEGPGGSNELREECYRLRYNDTTKTYAHPTPTSDTDPAGWVKSKFVRKIFFEVLTNPSDDEIAVTVTVTWQAGRFNTKQVVVRKNLLNYDK